MDFKLMEEVAQIIAEHASFFHTYGNFLLIPAFILTLVLDWKISKSNYSTTRKRIIRPFLTFLAIALGLLLYLINISFKPMVEALSEADKSLGSEMAHFEYLNVKTGEIEVLEKYKEKIVLLNFWGTYCPPCIEEFPDLKRLESEFSKDLVVVAISNEELKRINAFIQNVPSPSVVGMQKNYSWINPEKFLPITIIIKNGVVRDRLFGKKSYEEFFKIISTLQEE